MALLLGSQGIGAGGPPAVGFLPRFTARADAYLQAIRFWMTRTLSKPRSSSRSFMRMPKVTTRVSKVGAREPCAAWRTRHIARG